MGTIRLGRKEFEERAEQEVVAAAEPQGEVLTAAEAIEPQAEVKTYPHAKGRVRSEERKGLLARDASILFEDEKRRGRNMKLYRKNNGTIHQIVSNYPMHFETAEGMQEIDNTLEDKGDRFETRAGKYKIGVAKTTKQDGTLKFSDGEVSIEWNYLPEGDAVSDAAEQRSDDGLEYKKQLNKVVYGEVSSATDIEYRLEGENVKENIIVREKKEEYRYRFELKLTGVEPRISDDGMKIEFYKPSNEKVAEIPAPYMYDAAGARSEDVYYELEEEEGKYAFTVVADPLWVNDAQRIMPVTIDPQIVTGDNAFLSVTRETQTRRTSGGGWSTRYDSNPTTILAYQKTDEIVTSSIELDISGVQIQDCPISSVKLILKKRSGTDTVCSNGRTYYVVNGEVAIDITNRLYNGRATVGIESYSPTGISMYISSARIEIDYVLNEMVKPTFRQFTPIHDVAVNVDVESGETSLSFEDTKKEASLLGFSVMHMFSTTDEDYHCGKGFRLNLDEKLEMVDMHGKRRRYLYTDANGRAYYFKETFYYMDGETKVYIDDADSVEIKDFGKYEYKKPGTSKGYTAYMEHKSATGMRIVYSRPDVLPKRAYNQSVFNQLCEYSVLTSSWTVIGVADAIASSRMYEDVLTLIGRSDCILLKSNEVDGYKNALTEEGDANDDLRWARSLLSLYDQTPPSNRDESWERERAAQAKEVARLESLYNQKKARVNEYRSRESAYLATVKSLYPNLGRKAMAYLTDGTTYKEFDTTGALVSICNQYGNALQIERDSSNRATKLQAYRAQYQSAQVVSVNAVGSSITLIYDAYGRLSTVKDPDGKKTSYIYSDGKLQSVNYSCGKVLTFSYDSKNRIQSIIHSYGQKCEFGYNGGTVSINAYSTVNKIDNNGAATGTVTPISSLAFTYTDNQTFITDQDGNREIYVFASDGNLAEYYKEQERRIVKAEKYTYQAYSKQETKSARKDTLYKTQYEAFAFTDGNTTTVTLNEFNQAVREVQTIEADGAEPARTYETEFTYDGGNRQVLSGKQTRVTYALGSGSKSYTQVEQHEYDEQYRAMSTTQYVSGEENGKGKLIHEIVYAPSGTVWKESVYNSRNTGMKYCQEYAYDELGRIQSKFNEFGTDYKAYSYIGGLNTGSTLVNTERTYFGSGSEAEGWKTYSYDSANRVTAMNYKINYFSEGVHSISYQNGQVTKLTDGKYTLLYTYDAKRRVTNVNVNGDSYVSMAYTDSATENGKRVDKVTATYIARASGVQDSFTQVSDKFGNTLRVEYNGDTLMEGSYHADSRPDQLSDHVSGETEQYHYTGSKLESVTRSKDGAEVYREEYSYNEYGDISEVNRTCNTHTEKYTYQYADTAARELVKVTSATNGSSGIGSKIYYDDLGRAEAYALSGLGNKEFAKEQYSYKLSSGRAGGYVSQIHYFKTLTAGTLIEDGKLQYCYDSAGNISLVKNGNGDQLARYKYDNANRLEREDNWQLGRSYYIEYDRYGNITVKKEGAAAQNNISYDTTKSYTYDAAGRLINYNGEGFAYDGMGNPTTYRNKAVVWEKGRQMKSFNGIAFEYDGRGRRIKKGNVTYIYDASGNLISSSDGLRYLYGVNGIYAVEDNDRSYYFRKDAQGNIIALLDGAGGVVVQYVYDAWGNHAVLDSNGNDLTDSSHIGNRNPIRYRGYFYDVETGLYYLQTRYYDPEIGRFLNMDDVSYADPEQFHGLNLYAYCGNDPVNRIDPNGNSWWSDFWNSTVGSIVKIIAGVGVIVALGVASVLTGGAILTGAFIGAAVGGLSSSIIGLTTGQSLSEFSDGFLSGVVIGGVSGAIGGIGAPTGTAATTLGRFGLAARASRSFFQYTSTQIGLNAILSGSAYLVESIANKGKISFSGFTASVISGAVSGRFSSGIRGMVNNIVLDFLTYQFGKFVEKNHWY